MLAEPGGGPNGAAIGPDGKVYVCNNGGFQWHESEGLLYPGDQPGDYETGRIERIDIDSGEVEVLYDACDGRRLCGPNDIVFDRHGGFWFTDHGKTRPHERDRTGVFYAQPDGSSIEQKIFPLEAPNGIGLSPDERTLYVAETTTGRLWAWDLDTGKVVWQKDFSEYGRGGNDCGICLYDGRFYYSTFFGYSASQKRRRGLPGQQGGR